MTENSEFRDHVIPRRLMTGGVHYDGTELFIKNQKPPDNLTQTQETK